MSDEKPKPNFGNVQGGSSSTAPAAPAESTRSKTAGDAPRTYTVAAGDSLSKIAKKFYGNSNDWKRIFEANRDTVENPDLIHPGQVLKIPEA